MTTKVNVDKFVEEFLKKKGNLKINQIYNIQDEKNPFDLQYYQLIAYLEFRNEINKYISGWSLSENTENMTQIHGQNEQIKIVQDNYCLIDKEWIRKWRKHVGYEEIKKYFGNLDNDNNKINDSMHYNNIIEIIENNSKDHLLTPLDNKGIYKNNEVILDSDFELINEKCYKLFTIGSNQIMDTSDFKKLPIFFFSEKYIVLLNDKCFWIVFKEKEKQIKFDIMVKFLEINENKKTIMDDIFKKDTNVWVKENRFNLVSDLEKEINIKNTQILIINKTLKYKIKNINI